jgi:peptide-methionine (S)-S-oxide reductase
MVIRIILGVLLMGSVFSAARAEPMVSTTAVLGGGCFWCLHHDMKNLKGVLQVESGYAAGTIVSPTYETYNKPPAGGKSHVEVVKITYNPAVLSYQNLLLRYFENVDPTDALGQFCDRGEEYRPIIITQNATERTLAEQTSAAVAAKLKQPVFVEIVEGPQTFWPAEGYHQDYAAKNQAKYQFYRWKCGRDSKIKALGLGGQ